MDGQAVLGCLPFPLPLHQINMKLIVLVTKIVTAHVTTWLKYFLANRKYTTDFY